MQKLKHAAPGKKFKYYSFDTGYDKIFSACKKELRPISKRVELIGSAAVRIGGKKELDIMLITDNVNEALKQCKKLGFKKKAIIGNVAYTHKMFKGMDIDLHVVKEGSSMINYFRKTVKIQKSKRVREEYDELKRSMNGKSMVAYKRVKGKFFRKLMV